MSKESIQENDPTVKQIPERLRHSTGRLAKKTRRVIPPGAVMSLAYVRKLPKRSRGPRKFPDMRIRFAFRHYINRHPDLTPVTKLVAEYIIRLYNFKLEKAWPSIATIADELSVGHATVSRAVKTLHDLGLIFIKSGGPSRRGSFGPKANEFVPNFWLVLNQETGAIIKNAKYPENEGTTPHTSAASRKKSLPQNRKTPLPQNEGSKKHANTRKYAESFPQNEGPCSDNGVGGASVPPFADAHGSTAPPEKEPEIDITGYETREFFITLKTLARELGITPERFLTSGNGAAGSRLDNLCYKNVFNGGKVVRGFCLEPSRPKNTWNFVCLELIAKAGTYRELKTKFNTAPDQVNGDSPVFIQYRIPPQVQEQAEKDFEAAQNVGYF